MNRILLFLLAISISSCLAVNTYSADFTVKLPHDQGEVKVSRAFVLMPEDDEPCWQAYQAVAKNDRKEAIKILKRAIKESPDTARYHHDLAIVYEIDGRWDDAEKEARRAVDLASGHRIHITTFNAELNFIMDMKRRFEDPCKTWSPGCPVPDAQKPAEKKPVASASAEPAAGAAPSASAGPSASPTASSAKTGTAPSASGTPSAKSAPKK